MGQQTLSPTIQYHTELLFVLPLSPMLKAGRNCRKPTIFAHALDLLLSDWELVMEP